MLDGRLEMRDAKMKDMDKKPEDAHKEHHE